MTEPTRGCIIEHMSTINTTPNRINVVVAALIGTDAILLMVDWFHLMTGLAS